jgi:hypothetical protein
MIDEFKFLMISAMYENGGNVTHRSLDGHPEMFVYPFESQLGSRLVNDSLSSTFPVKYRWPVFDLMATPEMDYKAIIDEEGKVRARTSHVSKFRDMPFDFSDDERARIYVEYVNKLGRSRGNNINAFFRATFDAWKDYKRTGKNHVYVGYSPIIVVDAEKILNDLPGAHVLHVVRNPWSAYADTKKRPVPLSIENYTLCWNLNQYHALLYKKKYPDRVHIVRYEDVVEDPIKTLGEICQKLGLEKSDSLKQTTWNSKVLDDVYPWGTIRKASPDANLDTARELSKQESEIIAERTWQYLDVFNFESFAK